MILGVLDTPDMCFNPSTNTRFTVLRASYTRPRRVRGVVLAWAHTPGVSWASPKLQMWVRDSIPPTVTP